MNLWKNQITLVLQVYIRENVYPNSLIQTHNMRFTLD